ncbi:MipA/OmpV family protein [Colwellia sp. 6M3]|mgnify:CR=1 FL=1|jgi:outer membrane scaffolding protein for murein synthesis (MipA/OmpV family)|uniref:MipA/OmpV family protein n=1 Tax=Colwellia sp. 6M3 TaxID=2759849 RepID=UPI0015F747F5|nr:MipA/OmpV family protein [Colwellia sp. 6M3]MBA6417019.1 MipA/OmpV family protein [Colwellia sp. 6M3]|tara:strand:- start:2182 stop:3048 length:867 start_codon:yes stop_codon:yes gene_type:complete
MQKLRVPFNRIIFSIITVLNLSLSFNVQAMNELPEMSTSADKPKWEAGAFVAVFNSPLYPGAAETQSKFLPVPFVIYRGKRLRVGEGGVIKAMAVDKPRFKVDLSLGAAFAANSDDAKVREGMPDLDFIFELGPEVSVMLNNTKESETWLNLQLRQVFSTDFSNIDDRGYIFQPEISYQGKHLFSDNDSFKVTFSSLFATKKTHQYFYQVDEAFSTSERPAYLAKGGYLGTEATLVNRFKIRENISIFLSTKVGFYKGASNEQSPLFKKDLNYAIGLGLKWTLYQSNE